jgi:hypothetical protein
VDNTVPIQNCKEKGGFISPLVSNFGLEDAIRKVQGNQTGLKLNGSHQLLFCTDDENTIWDKLNTIKKNAKAVIAAGKYV